MRRAWLHLFLASALSALTASAAEPFRVISNIFSVGASDSTVFVIATPKGLVLLNTGADGEEKRIRANIKKLGLDLFDVKIILISQADPAHVGNLTAFRRETGARLMVSEADAPLLPLPQEKFPTKLIDQTIADNDHVTIGGLTFTAHLTPGATRGCTTWTTTVRWSLKPFDVVFACDPTIPMGTKLDDKARDEYRHTYEVLRAIQPDVFLASRGTFFNLDGKFAKRAEKAPNPFIDRDGWKKFVDDMEARFTASQK